MALPLFIRKLMAPVEVKLVLSALSEEVRRIKNDSSALGASLGASVAAPKASEDILRWSKEVITKDIQNGKSPRVLALYAMTNVARNSLASGEFAIWAGVYRGMNSLSMKGQAIYALNAYCLDELTKLGQFTQEEKAAALKATEEEVRDMGG